MKTVRNKLVLFGAGKIGRSFIGQIFSKGGYEVVFVDISKAIVDELNRKKCYQVWLVNDEFKKCHTVKNVRGIHATNQEEVVNEVSAADLLAISVGVGALPKTLPIIARGLLKRFSADNRNALDIILAENMVDAADYVRNELSKHLPSWYDFDKLVGLVETSVGKMVPLISPGDKETDALKIYAEPYNTLIVDKNGFRNPVPDIENISAKENMKAWVERKLYIHNMGHTAAAYIGHFYYPSHQYIYEVLAEEGILEKVRNAMLQSASILLKKYPFDFTIEELINHIDDLLTRFQNKALADTIFRAGCDLQRKLAANDRFAGIIRTAVASGMPYESILAALVCALFFNAKDMNGEPLVADIRFLDTYSDKPFLLLSEVCGFDRLADEKLFFEAENTYKSLNELSFRYHQLINNTSIYP